MCVYMYICVYVYMYMYIPLFARVTELIRLQRKIGQWIERSNLDPLSNLSLESDEFHDPLQTHGGGPPPGDVLK